MKKEYTDILEAALELYYDLLSKQIEEFPKSGFFIKPKKGDIEKYFEPLMYKIEFLIKKIVDREIKLRYYNSYALPSKAEFFKDFKEELGDE